MTAASTDDRRPKRVLCVEAHPDDLAYFYGGAAARFALQGDEVRVITVTRGSQSTLDPAETVESITAKMRAEHERALAHIGVSSHRWLDGFVNHFIYDAESKLRLRATLIREIRAFKPHTVVSFDPANFFEENPDHILVAQLVMEAAAFAAYPLVHPEQLEEEGVDQHFVTRLLLTPTSHPDYYVDIAGEPFERKHRAGLAYASQLDLMIGEMEQRVSHLIYGPGEPVPERGAEERAAVREEMWGMFCDSMAADAAERAAAYYAENPARDPGVAWRHAEEFRLYFPGAVERLRDVLPDEVYEF